MVTHSIIRHLLSDNRSLNCYLREEKVSFDDVKRRLLLLERQKNRRIPDHFYRMNQDHSLYKINNIAELLTKGIAKLADEHLEFRSHKIYVKQEKQNEWQGLLPYLPPLVIQSAFLAKHKLLLDIDYKSLIDYFKEYIIPNFNYTALPHPYIPQLESYIKDQNGLHDLHMHLNGTTEIDNVWQALLFNPQNIPSQPAKIKEQIEQEIGEGYDKSLERILLHARNIRYQIFNILYKASKIDQKTNTSQTTTEHDTRNSSIYHPLCLIFDCNRNIPERWMPLEGLMYVIIFNELRKNQNVRLSTLFHQYLLILGLINRLLVQQSHQNGFEQFQKITLNDLRCDSEKNYLIRFLQLHGNESRNIKYLEGRFAPKDTERGNINLLKNIQKGWNQLLCQPCMTNVCTPQLKLIAHFIKEADNKTDSEIRHKELRKKLWEKANILRLMIKNQSPYLKNFVGIDAAASEFDTPPEVFAPIFKMLRRAGVKHFTYHAGEDFYHIIGGLRAIYEAVEFNQLSCGDRIGHGTAMGVSSEMWIDTIGDKILIRQGDYLDDLVFTYNLINSCNIHELNALLHILENRINRLYYDIYQKSPPLQVILRAWELRQYCPFLLFNHNDANAAQLCSTFDEKDWEDIQKLKLSKKGNDDALCALKDYHSKDCRQSYNQIIEIEVTEIFKSNHIESLQLLMLEFLHKKEIVIETLPTSNVRIGIHHNFDTYHLWNWLKWNKSGHSIPPITLGTDDAGIFSTNIYNEAANIYCQLTSQCKMTHVEAMGVIEYLDKNGQIYNFNN